MPGTDLAKELGTFDRESWTFDKPIPSSYLQQRRDLTSITNPLADADNTPTQKSVSEVTTDYLRQLSSIKPSDVVEMERTKGLDAEDEHISLVDDFKHLGVNPAQQRDFRFFGKSSGAMLVRAAMDLKNHYESKPPIDISAEPEHMFHIRPEFWDIASWERTITQVEKTFTFSFPPPDLMADLINKYFDQVNCYFPLLHRPTLEKNIQNGLHLEDDMFGSVVLLVCANGSKWSTDPRVYLDGAEETNKKHSSGWNWFNQVHFVRKTFMEPPALWDLQFYCVSLTSFFVVGVLMLHFSFRSCFCHPPLLRKRVGRCLASVSGLHKTWELTGGVSIRE